MKRREFITVLGAATAWPLAARAQQGDRVRRIGVLLSLDENDPEEKRRYSAFTQALADLGWTDGRNVRMDFRWAGAGINRIQALAQELVATGKRLSACPVPGTCKFRWTLRRSLHGRICDPANFSPDVDNCDRARSYRAVRCGNRDHRWQPA
jgi:hypothetical protein